MDTLTPDRRAVSPFAAAFACLLGLALSYAAVRGTGADGNLFQTVSLFALVAVCAGSRRLFLWLALPLVAAMALYFPVGLNYGIPDTAQIASLFGTDRQEAVEFLGDFPLWQKCAPAVIVAALLVFGAVARRSGLRFSEGRSAGALVAAVAISAAVTLALRVDSETWVALEAFPLWKYAAIVILIAGFVVAWRRFRRGAFPARRFLAFLALSAFVAAFAAGDFRLFWQGARLTPRVASHMHRLRTMDRTTLWRVTGAHPAYRTYVLVIGESVRRDYMHAYGYPVRNTDFMESVPGTIFEGFTAEGDHTLTALGRALAMTPPGAKDPDYRYTVTDLASAAGFSTAWFSTQGFADKHDTPVTAVGIRAERSKWLRVGSAGDVRDRDLLAPLAEELKRAESRPKFIVLHLTGSHPPVCQRELTGDIPPPADRLYAEPACYADSIRATDRLLADIHALLQKQGAPFSMVYFADHGLSSNRRAGRLMLSHADPANHARDIPLFRCSSDDRERRRVSGVRFGSRLPEGVMQWLGITTEQVPAPQDLFAPGKDADLRGHAALMQSRRDDPAIVVPGLAAPAAH